MVNFKVIGSNPVGGLRFFFAPRSWHVEKIISHFISPSLKFTIFLYHTHDDFDIADPRSMQDACQCGLARHESIVAQCLEHPIGVRKIIGSNPVWESRRWILKSLLTKCETSFFIKKKVWRTKQQLRRCITFLCHFCTIAKRKCQILWRT